MSEKMHTSFKLSKNSTTELVESFWKWHIPSADLVREEMISLETDSRNVSGFVEHPRFRLMRVHDSMLYQTYYRPDSLVRMRRGTKVLAGINLRKS